MGTFHRSSHNVPRASLCQRKLATCVPCAAFKSFQVVSSFRIILRLPANTSSHWHAPLIWFSACADLATPDFSCESSQALFQIRSPLVSSSLTSSYNSNSNIRVTSDSRSACTIFSQSLSGTSRSHNTLIISHITNRGQTVATTSSGIRARRGDVLTSFTHASSIVLSMIVLLTSLSYSFAFLSSFSAMFQ